jgi:hypothetical protein
MDCILFGSGILLIIVGVIVFIFAARFGKWLIVYGFKNKLILGAVEDQNMTKEELKNKHINKWPRRGLWLIWISLVRILATMIALVGIITIIESIVDY